MSALPFPAGTGHNGLVTREEATRECERLNRESPEREAYRWFARHDASGDWEIARMRKPEGMRGRGDLKAGVEPAPVPPHPVPAEVVRPTYPYGY